MTNQQTNNAWWARRWQTWLKQLGLDSDAEGGLRGCRVKRMEISPGLIQAQVQDRELGAVAVEIRLPVLQDAQWERVIEALGGQAIYAAQLLAGNMPPEIEDVFAQAGASLLPASLDEVQQSCSTCPPGARPCRPLAAVYWQLGEMVEEDPWLLLRLRGRDRQQVLTSIHERRNMGAEPANRPSTPASQPGDDASGGFYTPVPGSAAAALDETPSLEDQIGDYLGPAQGLGGNPPPLVAPGGRTGAAAPLGPAYAYVRRPGRLWAAADRLPPRNRARMGISI